MGICRILHTHKSFSYCWCERIIHKVRTVLQTYSLHHVLHPHFFFTDCQYQTRHILRRRLYVDWTCTGTCMGTCMGVVLIILIPNQHISILQFVVFTEQQITEELYEEGLVLLYAFLGITIIGTYKGITEVPGIISEQFVIYIETTRAEIFDNENSRCSRVSFTERMVPP